MVGSSVGSGSLNFCFSRIKESPVPVLSKGLKKEPEVFTKEPVTKHWFLDFLFFPENLRTLVI